MDHGLSILTRAECLDALSVSTVGRLAITAQALPAIVPVSFALSGSSIVFRTETGGMLARACDGSVVAFEVDSLGGETPGGWSVLVVGVATLLDGSAALRAQALGVASAAGPGRDQFVGITIGKISGRHVGEPGELAPTGPAQPPPRR
jgi:nitroimidazol reductase NimA-like FMN-containing flavoprotein (pyridoxamine 5'-phosphate oxidase superfamily)